VSRTTEASQCLDQYYSPFLNDVGVQLIKRFTAPRTHTGFGRFASYKSASGEWLIGYGSKKLGKSYVGAFTRGEEKQILKQLVVDLEAFADKVNHYVQVNLTANKKGAVLSYAHSVGLIQFKESRLLELINGRASRAEIIREWSPFINKKDLYPEILRNRRRAELNAYISPDKDVPLMMKHRCKMNQCLLNIGESFNGAPNQIRAIEYLEKKILEWDPSGETIRRFFRYWNEKPGGVGSESRPWFELLDDQ